MKRILITVLSCISIVMHAMNLLDITKFHAAIRSNDTGTVSSILQQYHDAANIPDPDGQTALHIAAGESSSEMITLLVVKGNADLEARNKSGETPIYNAVLYMNDNGVDALIAQRAAVNVVKTGEHQFTPLQLACAIGYPPTIRKLLDGGANRALRGNSRESSLDLIRNHHAYNEELRARFMLSQQDLQNLHREVSANNIEYVTKVLGEYPDVANQHGRYQETALHIASNGSSRAMIDLLITKGKATGDAQSRLAGNTPLMNALITGHYEEACALINHKAGINTYRNHLLTYGPLHIAAYHGNVTMTRLLLLAGADPHYKASDERTPLDLAREYKKTETIAILEPYDLGRDLQ